MSSFRLLLGLLLSLFTSYVAGQNIGINEDGSAPDASAILDIKSINKGLLVPRLTTAQRVGIAAPANGLIVYDNNTLGFWYYDGNAWVEISSGTIVGNTLDGAYDEGGAGAGRIIDADAGPVSVQGTDGFEVTGSYTPLGTIPTSGTGTRMFFYPEKSAFRAGTVNGTNWDTGFVGNYSVAMGNNPLASGSGSVAIGSSPEATGTSSVAIGNQAGATASNAIALGQNASASGSSSASLGFNSNSTGLRSTAIGNEADAGANYSIALGGTTVFGANSSLAGPGGTVEGEYGFAIGPNASAAGDRSVSIGSGVSASGAGSFALGTGGVSSGPHAVTMGFNNTANNAYTFALGRENLASAQYAMAMGYNSEASGIYAFAAGLNGNASGQASVSMGSNAQAQGNQSVALGGNTLASGNGSVAVGWNSDATANFAVALGSSNTASAGGAAAFNTGSTASGVSSVAFSGANASGAWAFGVGNSATASGDNSLALGYASDAVGNYSVALGQNTTANGVNSAALNFYTSADAHASTALGRYNIGTGNPVSWVLTDPLFEIGIGSSPFAKANALTVLKNGNTGIMNPNPDAALDVVGTFQLVDGTQAAGRVLTSDATGNASWAIPATGGNTLDEAYDQGGPGAGRTINAENGAVHINRNSSGSGTALEISLNSSYTLSERSAINTTNSGTGLETYTNIYRTGGPPFGQGLYITNEASENIIGKDGVVLEFNEATTLNYLGENRGFVYDVTYNGGSSGSVYGYQANIEGSGSATKYGAQITIPPSSGGTHYGIYSDVQDASGYAAYLLGRTSLGNSTSNRYLMPAADGAAGEVMTTDGSGNVSWTTLAIGGGSLDEAYDDGGTGAGRVITADAGVVSVQGTDGFEVTGAFNSGATIGNPGAGVRMFFNPRTAAFRAGRVTGTQWNQASVGTGSAAFGLNNTVSGSYSVAFGNSNQVISPYSVAMGENCQAQGAFSVAMGGSATATGESAIAIGEAATAFGDLSVAFSEGTANGGSSLAHGKGIIAAASYEFAIGEYNTTYTPNGTDTDRAFVVGNGTAPAARSNALLLKKNGELTINDEYTLPNTDGTEGQTLVTDGAGTVSWSGPVAFSAHLNTNSSLNNGNYVMTTVDFTSNCTFNTTQVRFDAPADGVYSFTFNDVSQATIGSSQGVQIVNGFAVIRQATWITESTGTVARSFTFILELDAGDIITFDKVGNRTLVGSSNYPACRISGHLVR